MPSFDLLTPMAIAIISIIILVFLLATIRFRRKHPSPHPPDHTGVDGFDELASLWIRQLSSEGLTRVHDLLMQPQPERTRAILYRWLARWSGLERAPEYLKRALENRAWPEHHPEGAIWQAWLEYVTHTGDPTEAIDSLLSAYNLHGHTIGIPAVTILIRWLLEARRFADVWNVIQSLPETVLPRVNRRLSLIDDVIRRIVPHLLTPEHRQELRHCLGWLREHYPDHPLVYWTQFQIERTKNQKRAVTALMNGIHRTDHYWLYRTLETFYLEQESPPAIQEFYVRRLHETGHTLRHKVLLLLHYLRIEHLTRADELLHELSESLSGWPPYWMWKGYTATNRHSWEGSAQAWATYWTLIRQKSEAVHPFRCEVCGYGCPRWWDYCPSCRRLGTLDLELPETTGPRAMAQHLKADLELIERPFDPGTGR